MIPKIGILQGRLTASNGRGIQFFPTENWENEFELAKKIGFECMELLVKKDSYDKNPLWSRGGVEKTKRLAEKSNIKIFSVHAFYQKNDSYPETLSHLIRQSAIVGAKTILVSFFDENSLKTDTDKALARKNISQTLALCEKLDIRLGVETEIDAVELLEFIRSFNHPNIGVYYDIGNMASMGANVPLEVSLFRELVFGVHIKDRLANKGKTVPIGTGCADFKNTLIALKEIGYTGPLVIHGARNENIDDLVLNTEYFCFIRNFLSKIYIKGGSNEQEKNS